MTDEQLIMALDAALVATYGKDLVPKELHEPLSRWLNNWVNANCQIMTLENT